MSEDRLPLIDDEEPDLEDEDEESGEGEGPDDVDAGDEDAGGGDADEEGQESRRQGDQEDKNLNAEPRRKRASDTVRELRRRAQEAERQNADFQRRFADLEARSRAVPVDPQAAARAEAEELARIELMSPAEQARYFYQKGRNEFSQALASVQLNTADTLDRQSYATAARSNPLARKYQDQVETLLQQERGAGNMRVSREAILQYLVGREVLDKAAAARPGQARAARARVRGQQTRAGSARGDTARPGRDNDRAAYLKRLDGYKF